MGKREDGCVEAAPVNQRGDLVPAAFYLSLCACEGFGVAAGLWSRPKHNPLLRGQAWSDWSTDWQLSLFQQSPLLHFTSPFYFRLYTTPRRSHLQPFLQQQPFCALLCLYSSSCYRKPGFTVMSHVFLLPRLVFGGLTGTSCSPIMPVIFFIINFKIFSKLL